MNDLNWLNNIKSNINSFLENMSENEYSYFKYSLSGDILNSSSHWGLANLVFAVKILYITGLIDEISETKRENLYKNIIKFSDEEGYLYDPYITKIELKDLFEKLISGKIKRHKGIKESETRQTFTALRLLDKKPLKPFLHIPYTQDEAKKFIGSLNWSLPWGAGAHFSFLLYFLYVNNYFFQYKDTESKELINFLVEWVFKIQSKENGCWYLGENVPLFQKVNGAMKVLTAFHAVDIWEFPYPKKLIDTALLAANDKEACSNFNVIYVLYSCNLIEPDYRKSEIEDFCLKRLDIYRNFYYPEIGGFSFFENKANTYIYGKKISVGKNEPDIHGTILFLFGIAIIDKILRLDLDFKVPVN